MHKNIFSLCLQILFFLSLTSCAEPKEENENIEESVIEEKAEMQKQTKDSTVIMQMSRDVVNILDSKDYRELSQFISEEEGVLFSPYTFIDSSRVVLSKDSFLTALDSGKFFMWGLTDGKGDSIRMSIKNYFGEYVYDKKFADSDTVSFNEFIGLGNTINNIKESFPRAKFVEYHFFGSEMYSGMDWKSLILVFDKINDQYFLRAIVHNEWTI